MNKKIDNIVRHAQVSEKAIERYLTTQVKEMGGICLKYSQPGSVGYPDRICLLPGGVTLWIEIKSKGEKPRALQSIRFQQMASIEHPVYVCDSKAEIDKVLKPYKTKTT